MAEVKRELYEMVRGRDSERVCVSKRKRERERTRARDVHLTYSWASFYLFPLCCFDLKPGRNFSLSFSQVAIPIFLFRGEDNFTPNTFAIAAIRFDPSVGRSVASASASASVDSD